MANVKNGATLRISFVGCKPATVKWEGTPLTITLEDDIETLDEVVVVGFGTQKKVNLTGAVSTVSGKEIAARPVNTVADALQGMAAGLDVLGAARGGQLGAARSMNIRGTGTIGSGSSVNPLVLIDGMEGDINQLNPADVENISILKDAAAASIYGSRAAGGVILITTRTGKEGKVSVNYSDSFRWSSAVGMPKMADSWTWANVMNQAANNNGQNWFSQDYLDKLKEVVADPSKATMFRNPTNNHWEVWDLTDILPIGNTDWLDEHFGTTPFSQEHNISLNGGTDKYNYYFSGNLLSQDGTLRYGKDNLQRYTINGKINVQIAKWLRFGYSTRWYRGQYDAPSFVNTAAYNELYHNIVRYWPIIPTHDPNGYPVVESFIDGMENGGRYKTAEDKLDHQFSFILTPLKGLTVNAEFNYRTIHYNQSQVIQQAYGWDCDGEAYENNPNGYPYGAGGSGSRITEYNQRANYFNPNVFGTYSFTVGDGNEFKVMAGFQSEWYNQKYFSAQRNGIINRLPYLSMTNGNTTTVGGGEDTWSTAGWFGRINYDYKGRYLVEGNIRYDGSSRFRSGNRWTTSPSFSLGWNVAREAFMENTNSWLNTLKARYSWGKLGNQNTDNWYPTYVTMGYAANASGWLVGGKKDAIAAMPSLVSSSLTWEKNRTWDIGLDWGMFNNRFTGTFDYYNRRTQDMVGPGYVLPTVFGATVPKTNNLAMTSRGWELTISWRDRIQDFSYGVTFNLYDHTTTVDEYPTNDTYDLGNYYNGRKLGEIWGYTSVGIAKSNEEMNAHLDALDAAYTAKNGKAPASPRTGQNRLGTGWQAGDMMYADLNGDGVISTGAYTLDNHGDLSVIGNSTPRYNFGLNLEAQYKGFDLKVFFQGTMKRDYWAGGPMMFGACQQGKWQAVVFEPQLDYFRPEDTTDPLGPNVNSYLPRVNWGGPSNTTTQTKYLQNAAYCRLKNVTLGYTIPTQLTHKLYIERARVFVSGENLANITNFTKMGDPELIEAYNNGYGFAKVYPISRVFSVGLNVTF
ncbi:MAG: TonB-dependent receptor [Paramuribaculum sp.]|nr:TonB-dependent receptor [Paramuribaculum sp.]